MQKFTYPSSDLDNKRALLDVLGSFWARTYEGVDQLTSYARATASAVAQTQLNLLETVAALSRYDVPVFHTENWYPVVLRKSEMNTTAANQYRFDVDAIEFNDSTSVQFNQYAGRDFFVFPAPTDLRDAGQFFDRLLFPSFALMSGVDFSVDSDTQTIAFVLNPFENDSVQRQPVYSGDTLVDEEITLWGFKAQFDYQYVFRQFAYAVNINLRSSDNAKNLVNAVISGLLAGGASAAILAEALAAVFDVPVAKADGEIVEVITIDNRGLLICTDAAVYRFSPDAVPIVAVGDRVLRGDQLVDVFRIFEVNRGEVSDTVDALALDQGYTSACFYSDLIFENRDVPLVVDAEHPSGYTYVRFELGGFPGDVRGFFDELHARGIEQLPTTPAECDKTGANKRLGTLAHILDRRANPAGEPQPDDLPATINPLKFLVQNVLRNNAVIAAVNVSTLGKNHLGLYNIRHVRQLLPPGSGLFLIYTLSSKNDQIDGTKALVEAVDQFKAAEPLEDAVPVTLVKDGGVIVRTVSGTCQ